MQAIARVVLTGLLLVAVTSSSSADEKTPGKRKKTGDQSNAAIERLFQLPKTVELNDEQKEELAALRTEFQASATAATRKVQGALTVDQRKARAAATKAARAAGKKGKELRTAVEAASTLTPEQKKARGVAQKELIALKRKIQVRIHDFLTDEQKAQLPKLRPSEDARKKAKRKKNADS